MKLKKRNQSEWQSKKRRKGRNGWGWRENTRVNEKETMWGCGRGLVRDNKLWFPLLLFRNARALCYVCKWTLSMNISPEYFNILNHLAVFVDTQRPFTLSHRSEDRGNFCKWEQSLNVTQSIIAFRSSSHTNYNDVIIKNNTKQPVFGNEKSTDILATDLCSFYTNTNAGTHTQP